MLSYPALIGGVDADHTQWIHTIRASALLRDEMSALRLKRRLDRGSIETTDDPRIVGRVGVCDRDQIAEAGAAAARAQPGWSAMGMETRLEFARQVGKVIHANADRFVEILTAEGHPKRLAEWEVSGAVSMTSDESLDLYRRQMRQTSRIGDREIQLVRKPDGVVCVHPPYNAPTANSIVSLGALIVGNTIVVKAPRSSAFGTAWFWRELVAPTLDGMGAPAGTINVICAAPNEALDIWLDSDHVDDLMFFGDSERGIEIGRRWSARGKKAVLELGGNDGVLVWRDADADLAARALAECFYGSAQVCIVPKYAIVHPEIAPAVLARLVELARDIRPGYPEDDDALLSPVLKAEDFTTVLADALAHGAELVCGGNRLEVTGEVSEFGYFVEPTVVTVHGFEVAERLDAVRQETFFPLLPIIVPSPDSDARLLSDCIDFINANPYGLRNSLWAGDTEVIAAFCERVHNGGLLKVNDSHIGFVVGLPSQGGAGLSGGPYGEGNFPILRTSRLQGISVASDVVPREAIFDSSVS
ncbi:aldehyde dehydrogenase [Nocardia sp. BMG51109]|uniref:aldehyde dehydrogenase family protein n=1 Tax=Nocardia sp. BMG51109 TaxID=1056816 RepID=UPI000467182D|nr:aldehyde dehydrogenase [Nocardia sp. BMG51109]